MTWTAPLTRKARYADAIRRALLERARDVDESLAIALSAPAITPYPYRRLSYSALAKFHSAVLELIPFFVNYINLHGVTASFTAFPMWTRDSLGKYLQLTRLLDPAQYRWNQIEWFKQIYAIINQLLYTVDKVKFSSSKWGFYKETKSASCSLSQDFSTLNPWLGSGDWTVGHTEILNGNTNSYVTEASLGDYIQSVRMAEYVEDKFPSAEWSGEAIDKTTVSISGGSGCGHRGGGGTGTSDASAWAKKSVDRLYFRFVNSSDYRTPAWEAYLTGTQNGTVIDQQTLIIPELASGVTYQVLIKEMPEMSCEAIKIKSFDLAYSYTTSFGDADDVTLYALVDHHFNFRG